MKDEIEKAFQNVQRYMMGDSSEPYSEKVISYAYEPVNIGEIKNPDGKGYVKGDCGDELTLWIKIQKEVIAHATFLSEGCGASIACGCAITQIAKGKTPYQASKMTPQDVIRFLDGLPASHIHCAVLAVQTLQKALDNMKHIHSRKEVP